MSALRLAVFAFALISGYYYFKTGVALLLLLTLLLLAGFFVLIRMYDQRKRKLDTVRSLAQINQTEILLLDGAASPYHDGAEFINPHHPYSYDLDMFGKGSLYQHLNRTTTSFGKTSLAENLLEPDTKNINTRQHAIEELSKLTDFRQQVQAAGLLNSTEENKFNRLTDWLKSAPAFRNKASFYLLLIFPAATLLFLLLYIITNNELTRSVMGILLVVNLAISFAFGKKMVSIISVSTDINKTLMQFSDQLQLIDQQSFNSELLRSMQQGLRNGQTPAPQAISMLASRFNYLDYLYNVFISPILNGFLLFHVQILFSLDEWKKKHGQHVLGWLQTVGEMEALNSFAGMLCNNPDFCFPGMCREEDLTATEMGHPLIRREKRINNSISFQQQKFVVLTGSNMSGKSTFLRTLGVNMVLARAGAAVCASSFRFFPYDVYVSMRITDSLQDSESFFYAELKRLQTIIHHISSGNKTFIILDEILRGTNSNDKHSGTVGLIRQLIDKNACGIIATHDLSVADLAQEYPHYVSANCFESEIVNDELIFDYKIKSGVCTRLSASFLMKKLGIIK